jgi:hypothetical protein
MDDVTQTATPPARTQPAPAPRQARRVASENEIAALLARVREEASGNISVYFMIRNLVMGGNQSFRELKNAALRTQIAQTAYVRRILEISGDLDRVFMLLDRNVSNSANLEMLLLKTEYEKRIISVADQLMDIIAEIAVTIDLNDQRKILDKQVASRITAMKKANEPVIEATSKHAQTATAEAG